MGIDILLDHKNNFTYNWFAKCSGNKKIIMRDVKWILVIIQNIK